MFIKVDDNIGKIITISTKPRKQIRILEQSDINKIVQTYKDFLNDNLVEIAGFSKKVSSKEIQENDYSLNPGRYVGIDESN
ncbi:N-6 DNA methylase, partial [bacterium]|nr:N-6 DNA methylase [bacterium]